MCNYMLGRVFFFFVIGWRKSIRMFDLNWKEVQIFQRGQLEWPLTVKPSYTEGSIVHVKTAIFEKLAQPGAGIGMLSVHKLNIKALHAWPHLL